MSVRRLEDFYRFLRGNKNLAVGSASRLVYRLPKEIELFDEKEINDFYFKLIDSDFSSTHKRSTYYALRYYCEFKGIPFFYKPPRAHVQRRKHATLEEIWKLLEVIEDKRDLALVTLHCYTGLRPSEIIKLKKQDLDLENGLLSIKETKTHFDRNIPIHKKAISVLGKYLISRKDTSDYLFKSKTNDKHITLKTYQTYLKNYCQKANVKTITPYMIRHTFATCYVENGGSIKALKEIMGHKNILTTEHYIHESEKIIKEDYKRACPEF